MEADTEGVPPVNQPQDDYFPEKQLRRAAASSDLKYYVGTQFFLF